MRAIDLATLVVHIPRAHCSMVVERVFEAANLQHVSVLYEETGCR